MHVPFFLNVGVTLDQNLSFLIFDACKGVASRIRGAGAEEITSSLPKIRLNFCKSQTNKKTKYYIHKFMAQI